LCKGWFDHLKYKGTHTKYDCSLQTIRDFKFLTKTFNNKRYFTIPYSEDELAN